MALSPSQNSGTFFAPPQQHIVVTVKGITITVIINEHTKEGEFENSEHPVQWSTTATRRNEPQEKQKQPWQKWNWHESQAKDKAKQWQKWNWHQSQTKDEGNPNQQGKLRHSEPQEQMQQK